MTQTSNVVQLIVETINRKLEELKYGPHVEQKRLDPEKEFKGATLRAWKDYQTKKAACTAAYQAHCAAKDKVTKLLRGKGTEIGYNDDLRETQERAQKRAQGTTEQRRKKREQLEKLRGQMLIASAEGSVPKELLQLAQKLGVL